MPSGNLRDHASGIAGQDARQRSSHGSLVGPPRQERTSDLETGTRTTTETRLYEDGYSVVESTAQHRDGSSSHITTRVDLDANQVERVSVHKDAQGNVDKDIITGPIDGTQDPNADTNSGGGCNPITGVCHSKPATDPNRVNPGPEGAVPTAGAPMLRVDQRGLVGDPDMVRRNGNGTPRMLEPGNPMNRVNPPGPSDGP